MDPRLQQMLGIQPQGMQAPMAQPAQPPSQLSQFLSSPGMAMASAAGNNFQRMQNGQQLVNPMNAYQDVVRQQANIADQQRRGRVQEDAAKRAQEKHAKDMDPQYAFQAAKARGLIPPDMTLEEFTRMGLRDTAAPSNVREWDYYNTLDEAQQKQYLDMKRASQSFTGPAGAPGVRSAGGDAQLLYQPEEMIEGARGERAAVTEAQKEEEFRWGQVENRVNSLDAAEEAWGNSQRLLDSSNYWLEKLEDGSLTTGFVDNALMDIFGYGSEEMGAMEAESILQTLFGLQITKLTPVSEKEFEKVSQMWMNLFKQETPNKGTLKRAIMETQRLQDKITRGAMRDMDRLRTYSPEEAQRYGQSNAWFQDQAKRFGGWDGGVLPAVEDTIGGPEPEVEEPVGDPKITIGDLPNG